MTPVITGTSGKTQHFPTSYPICTPNSASLSLSPPLPPSVDSNANFLPSRTHSSQVYSADMFHTVFASDPMNAAEGRRYRHTVLERGGSQEEMRTLEDFLGRKPNTEAFYEELGIS